MAAVTTASERSEPQAFRAALPQLAPFAGILAVAMILPIRVKRRVLSPALRWPTARENENLSALPHVEALHERRLRVL